MRSVPPALQARLASGATTLANVWLLRRTDGVRLGFTDHDIDLVVDGVTCRAAAGFDASAAAEKLGFAVSGGEIAGALLDDGLTEEDVIAGRYDGASVEHRLVDWTEPSLWVRLRLLTIGEITREGASFRAELRSLAHRLDEACGRLYLPRCDADLGDVRCRVDLAAADRTCAAAILAVEATGALLVSGLDAVPAGHLIGGRLTVLTGANAGFVAEIAAQEAAAGAVRLTLWREPTKPFAAGDALTASAGCDKTFATCRDRFANAANFRGFPHMPGDDRLLEVASAGDSDLDGGVEAS